REGPMSKPRGPSRGSHRMNRSSAALLGLALLAAPTAAQDEAWTQERLDVAVAMRDGAALAADVLLPQTPGRYPTVVVQTPYDRTLMRPALRGEADRETVFVNVADRAHYAYV